MKKIKDSVVVITGGSRGLGKSIAQALISKQATVIISSKDKAELEATAQELGATAILADVTREGDLVNLANKVVASHGTIDIWINNAGIWLPRGPIETVDMVRAHQLFEVNVFGMMYGSRAAITQMKKQESGTIVNMVSTAALQGRPNSAVYSSSKHAMRGFTDSIREEFKGTGISVIGVYPGGIKTDLFEGDPQPDFNDFMSPEFVAQKIVDNLEKKNPDTEQILRRPGQK